MKCDIVLAGVGGQGILSIATVLGFAAVENNLYLKQAETHGMSQRGGSVSSDVRFGEKVYSPMVPSGEADYLVVLSPDQAEPNRWQLREGGKLITPAAIPENTLRDKRSLNVGLLGWLSVSLPFPESAWQDAIRKNLAPKLHAANLQALAIGRASALKDLSVPNP